MRLLFALLLIFLLPVQAGWAAVVNTCADAGRTEAAHLGHHVHAEGAAADPQVSAPPHADDAVAVSSDDAHVECPTCHSLGVAMPLDPPAPMLALARDAGGRFIPLAQPQAPPGRLLRPPTSRAA